MVILVLGLTTNVHWVLGIIKNRGYNQNQMEQLLFLYKFLENKHNGDRDKALNEFNLYCKDISLSLDDLKLEQIIKCIIDGLDYSLLIGRKMSVQEMNQYRLYIKNVYAIDKITDTEKNYYIDAGFKMVNNKFNERMIYHIRRFLKLKEPISADDLNALLDRLSYYNVEDWIIISYFYNIYVKSGSNEMFRLLDTDVDIQKLLKHYKRCVLTGYGVNMCSFLLRKEDILLYFYN